MSRALWEMKPTQPLLKQNGKSIDVDSLAELCLERYLDNFTIDICISHYVANSANASIGTMLLPTDAWDWMKCGDRNFIKEKIKASPLCQPDNISQLLIPLHMKGCHWGLIYVNIASSEICFDDGLGKQPAPIFCILVIAKILS